jgi:hypothetical protein
MRELFVYLDFGGPGKESSKINFLDWHVFVYASHNSRIDEQIFIKCCVLNIHERHFTQSATHLFLHEAVEQLVKYSSETNTFRKTL